MYSAFLTSRFSVVTVVLATAVSSGASMAAAPKLDYFFPAGAQRGQTVEVTASGLGNAWPVTAWTDRTGLRITAKPEKGKLEIAVEPDAAAGVAWIRLKNPEGTTSLKPFVIGTLPELAEQEPNDDPAKPQSIERSTVINGRLGKNGDVDTFAMPLTKGQTLVASFQSNRELGAAVDSVLQVCSAGRFVLEQNDDANGLDPLIAFTAPADGLYLIRAFGFPATPNSSISFSGSDSYIYRLTLTTGGFADHAAPQVIPGAAEGDVEVELVGWNIPDAARRITVPKSDAESVLCFHAEVANGLRLPVVTHASILESTDNSREKPQSLTLPVTVTGMIEAARDEDVFVFAAKKGQAVVFTVEADELGFLLDGVLAVLDSAGKVLVETDDAKRARDPQLTFTPPADGEYRLTLRDVYGHGGPRYVYRLTAQQPAPDLTLQLSSDAFVVKPGATVEVTVAVARSGGYDSEVEISAAGLPAGVTAASVKSLAKGDTAKSVKLVLQASADAKAGTFQVIGKSAGPMAMEHKAQLSGAPPHITHAWLTVLNAAP